MAKLRQLAVEAKDEDPRQHINLVFIGHVDAGKSTLCGSILYHMGMVDPRQIERFEKEAKERNRDSWFLAFIMDTSEEERAKGKTVEVGRAHFETDERRFTILDAPGHKNYVPHMISGAAQADIGCLVISARKGEFETGFEKGGQTREHATLCKTLGVNKLVVVINKMDDPTVEWSKERFDYCVGKLKPFLKGSGYKVKKDVIFMPLAGLSGMNVKEPVDRAVCPWVEELDFKEPLLATLSKLEITGRDALAPVVMPVLDRYAERGTVVMGKVERGTIRMGSKLTVCPTGQEVKVVQIEIKEEAVTSAKCGENVLIKVEKINIGDLKKGYVMTDSIATLPATNYVTVQMVLISLLEHRPIFTAGYDCIFHSHTVAEECEVMTLISETRKNKKGEEQKTKNPAFVKKGSIVVCQIKISERCVFTAFDDLEQLGRVTLRDEGLTIAIGKILSLDDGPIE